MIKSKLLASVILGGVLVLGASVTYGAWSVYGAQKEFEADGYILGEVTNETQEETDGGYYFTAGDKYKKKYPEKIVFTDKEGDKTITDNENFIHYMNEELSSFVKGVFIDLDNLDGKGISYYNIGEGVVARKQGNEYIFQSTDKEMRLKNFIWKISDSKYIIVSEKLKLHLSEGNDQEVNDYIELHYYDKGIVRLVHQTGTYQTIASEASVTAANGVKLNLADKTVYSGEEAKFSIAAMVIDSDDNIEVVEKREEAVVKDEPKEDKDKEEEAEEDGNEQAPPAGADSTVNNSNSSNTNNNASTSNNNSSVVAGGGSGNGEDGNNNDGSNTGNGEDGNDNDGDNGGDNDNDNDNDNGGEDGNNNNGGNTGNGEGGNGQNGNNGNTGGVEIPDEEETEVVFPTFEVTEFNYDLVSMNANILITDDDGVLDGPTTLRVIEAGTNKTVFQPSPYELGVYDLSIATSNLEPDKEYVLIANADYKYKDEVYNKDFISKVFRTDDVGITIEKDYVTEDTLSLRVNVANYSAVTDASLSVYNAEGEQIGGSQAINIQQAKEQPGQTTMKFDGLTSNTAYEVRLENLTCEGIAVQIEGQSQTFQTLKRMPQIGQATAEVNAQAGTFNCYIKNSGTGNGVEDPDQGIVNYRHELYATDLADDGTANTPAGAPVKVITKTDADGVTIQVDDQEVSRNTIYVYRLVAEFYDNETTREIYSGFSNPVSLDQLAYPYVEFTPATDEDGNVTGLGWDRVEGAIVIRDSEGTVAEGQNLTVSISGNDGIPPRTLKLTYVNSETPIPFAITGLKANTNYSVSVGGTVNLDQNDNPDEAKYRYIGGFSFKTGEKAPDVAVTAKVLNQDIRQAFDISFQLGAIEGQDSALSAGALKDIKLTLYPEDDLSSPISEGTVNLSDQAPPETEAELNNYNYDSTIKTSYYDRPVILTPETFGRNNEAYTKASYYTLVVENGVDYTEHSNPIRMVNPEEPDAEVCKFRIDTHGFVPDLPHDLNNAIKVTAIRNGDIPEQERNPELSAGTIVKYIVDASANSFPESGMRYAKTVTYHAYKVTAGYDGDQGYTDKELVTSVTLPVVPGSESLPTWTFEMGEGKDKLPGRGYIYYFTYEVKLDLRKNDTGQSITAYYPQDAEGGADKELRSRLQQCPKEVPVFQSYLYDTVPNGSGYDLTWKYRYRDVDNAYTEEDFRSDNGTAAGFDTQLGDNLGMMTVTGAAAGDVSVQKGVKLYHEPADYNGGVDPNTVLVKHKLSEDITDRLKSLKYVVEKNSSKLLIRFPNADPSLLAQIAGLKITVTPDEGEAKIFDYVPVTNGMVSISLMDISDMINKNLTVDVEAYYDGVLAGYCLAEAQDETVPLVMLQQYQRDMGYFYAGGNTEASGSLHRFHTLPSETEMFNQAGGILIGDRYNNAEANAEYQPEKNKQYSFRVDMQGMNTSTLGTNPATDSYYILKKAAQTDLASDNKEIQFNYIYPTVSQVIMTAGVTDAGLAFEYDGANKSSIDNSRLYMKFTDEVGKVLTNADGSPERSYEIEIQDKATGSYEVPNIGGVDDKFGALKPGTTYHFVLEFKFAEGDDREWHRVLDTDAGGTEQVYHFTTASNVNFNELNYEYENVSYDDKNMLFRFKPDIVTGYTLNFTLKEMENGQVTEKEIALGDQYKSMTAFKDGEQNTHRLPVGHTGETIEGKNQLVYGKTYQLIAEAVTASGEQVGMFTIDAPLKLFEDPYVDPIPRAQKDNITYTVTVSSPEFSLVDNQFTVRIWETENPPAEGEAYLYERDYRLSDSEGKYNPSKVVEIDLKKDAEAVLKENTSYTLEVSAQVDADYTTSEEVKEFKRTYVTKTLNNAGVGFGTITGSVVGDKKKQIQLNFYNLVGEKNIKSVDYTVYKSGVGMVLSESNEKVTFPAKPEDVEGQTLHRLQLKADVSGFTNGIYEVTIDFKDASGNVIERKNIQFDYNKSKILSFIQNLFR